VEHPSPDDVAVSSQISTAVRAEIGVPVVVEVLATGALPRFAFKAARVVDEA
jgi:hypothetical protein